MTRINFAANRRFAAFAFALAAACAATPLRAQAAAAAVTQDRVWSVDEVTQTPQLANEPQLARLASHSYPAGLLAFGIPGHATLELVVGSNGRVEQVLGVAGTHQSFANVARNYASAMRFRPATVDGRAVRCRVTVPVDFALAAD
jgi:TonB family protein